MTTAKATAQEDNERHLFTDQEKQVFVETLGARGFTVTFPDLDTMRVTIDGTDFKKEFHDLHRVNEILNEPPRQ